jgi:hypothetical protein
MTVSKDHSQAPARRPHTVLVGVAIVAVIGTVLAAWTFWPPPDAPPVDPPAKPPSPSSGPPWFADVAAASGVNFTYRNGEEAEHLSILESLGGGVALLDYDGDGLLDIFVTGGGRFSKPRSAYPANPEAYAKAVSATPPDLVGYPCKLFRNHGNCTFEDVTATVGLERPWHYTHGCAVADFDRDGWPDLLVTGYGQVVLLHNEPDGKGGRRFVDVTAKLGLADASWSTSAGWADLDGDGWPDLYVCHYLDWSFANHPPCRALVPGVVHDICPPSSFKPLVHVLYRNEAGKAFRDVTSAYNLRTPGCGLGVVLADLHAEGRPDIYVANDTNPNFLYVNESGKLRETALAAGVATDENGHANGSMGVDAGDYDGSGRPSLWVTVFQAELPALYRNLGKGAFQYHSRPAGIAAIGQQLVGFGTAFVDADNDGWEDLVIVNGHVFRSPPGVNARPQKPVLLHNVVYEGRRFFRDISGAGGAYFQTPAIGRGLAVGDLDNDGWPDIVINHTNSPVAILRNEAAKAASHGWLGIRLVGRDHRDVVGSTVILESAGRKLTRFAKGGGSYLSSSDRRLLFGLGSAQSVERVTVRWSWGQTQVWQDLEPGRYYELREGEAAARPVGGN